MGVAQACLAGELAQARIHFRQIRCALSLGMLAASASSNETGYITHKFARSLGLLAFDNQARV